MNSPPPKVSVLMSVYNGEKYLRQSIESILNQIYHDFEFIIINDGSTDKSLEIINSYSDSRIRLVNQKNCGLTISLNKAIQLSRGQYLARMDADDISLQERLKHQVDFLDSYPNYGLVGVSFLIIDHQSSIINAAPLLLDDCELRRQLLFEDPLAHGGVMIRKTDLSRVGPPFYRNEAGSAEDYDLWSRLAQVTLMSNLSQILYMYRINPHGVSAQNWAKQRHYKNLISRRNQHNLKLVNPEIFQWSPINKYYNSSIRYQGQSYPILRRNNYIHYQKMLFSIAWGKRYRPQVVILIISLTFSIISSFVIQPISMIQTCVRIVKRYLKCKSKLLNDNPIK